MANSEERLHAVLATLEQCRATLVKGADLETAQLLSVAILQLRMTLNKVAESELKALCDAIMPDDEPADAAQNPKSPRQRRRRPPMLKLVK